MFPGSNFIFSSPVSSTLKLKKVLNVTLQSLPIRMHVAKDFALAIVQVSQFLALQHFDVTVQDRQRSFQIVRGRGQRIRRPKISFLKLREFLRVRKGRSTGSPWWTPSPFGLDLSLLGQ